MKKNIQIKRKVSLCFFAIIFLVFNLGFIDNSFANPQKKKARKEPTGKKHIISKGQKGSWEFSTAASIDIYRMSAENSSETITSINIPARIGYFILNRIEIEPEINFNRVSGEGESLSSTLLMANISYNLSTSPSLMPFVLAGVGINNTSNSNSISESNTELAFNGGTGIKWFLSNRVAFRAEYRFLYYSSGEKDFSINNTHHKIYLGISLFF